MKTYNVVLSQIFLFVILAGMTLPINAQDDKPAEFPGYIGVDADYQHAPGSALERWQDMKFGLRIHWGLYTMVGGHESWCLSHRATGKFPSDEFRKFYSVLYQFFNPTDFNADQWMALIERAGMKYFTFTTKHHDGFCMWPTETTQKGLKMVNGYGKYIGTENHYSIEETPYKNDIVRALVEAARKKGIGIGLYYSHIDWHDPAFAWDPLNMHYPLSTNWVSEETYQPWDKKSEVWNHLGFTKESDPGQWNEFIRKERDQITELLTWYGKIDLLSLDIAWPPEAQQDAYDLAKMIRKLQPAVLIRHRGIDMYGDYGTPERDIPDNPYDAELDKPWQVIYPCGQAFSYLPDDTYKPASWILSTLIDIVAKGGNFQVGFGPMPNGAWHPEIIKRLEYVGDWLRVNGEAIYGTRPWKQWHEGEQIRFTRDKQNKYLYAIAMTWPGDAFRSAMIVPKEGTDLFMLGFDKPLKWRYEKDNGLTVSIPEQLRSEGNRPCRQAYVFKIEQ